MTCKIHDQKRTFNSCGNYKLTAGLQTLTVPIQLFSTFFNHSQFASSLFLFPILGKRERANLTFACFCMTNFHPHPSKTYFNTERCAPGLELTRETKRDSEIAYFFESTENVPKLMLPSSYMCKG